MYYHTIDVLAVEANNLRLMISHYEETATTCRKRADDSDAKRIEARQRLSEIETSIASLKATK